MLIDTFCRQVLDRNIKEDNKEIFILHQSCIDSNLYDICLKRIPCTLKLSKEILDNIKIHLANEKTLYYDCIRKTLFIGNEDYKRIQSKELTLDGSILYKDYCQIPEFIQIENNSLLTSQLPKFKIYNDIKYSIIKNSEFNEINLGKNRLQVLLTNIPLDYYKKSIILQAPAFMYNYLQEKYTVGINDNDIDNNDSIETYIESIIHEGILKPLSFRLIDKGNLLNINSYNRLIIARILGLPSIPAYIISGNNKSLISYSNLEDLTTYANQVFNPYFIYL